MHIICIIFVQKAPYISVVLWDNFHFEQQRHSPTFTLQMATCFRAQHPVNTRWSTCKVGHINRILSLFTHIRIFFILNNRMVNIDFDENKLQTEYARRRLAKNKHFCDTSWNGKSCWKCNLSIPLIKPL